MLISAKLTAIKLIYSILISAFFISLSNAAVASDDIFVSPSGNDSAAGNSSNPLATVEAALKKADEGTTIHVDEGIFRITRPLEISATEISIIGAGEYSRLPLSWKGLDPGQGAAAQDASVMISGSQGISFTDCEVAHTGNYGIWFKEGCEGCSVSRCCNTI
ncbi:MAG: hypothetical protein PUK70_07420 [Bacteroidales bacterium]|nr:hypothetical protein [Bacteroidales bacterium]MDY6002216.1 hypothetical protein [Candidatus Cryptobacteroides sp.]